MDPITVAMTAFAAVQKTVQVIKQAQKTVNDVSSLGPMLGQYFGAKQNTIKALNEAKKKGGSSLAQAIQIEMELLSQKKFEDELKMIFMTTGNIDVWNKIQERVLEDQRAEAHAARRAKEEARRKAKKMAEMIETGILIGILVLLVPPLLYVFVTGLFYARDQGWFK